LAIEEAQTVWILGAGFSRALGGPLLSDLFRLEPWRHLTQEFPESDFPGLATELWASKVIFNYGKDRQYWDNAEKFLATAENAFVTGLPEEEGDLNRRRAVFIARASDALQQLQHHVEVGLPSDKTWEERWRALCATFRERAHLRIRRALAAECMRFCAAPYTEVWEPYRAWAKSLRGGRDHLLTFNYDCAVEISFKLCVRDGESPKPVLDVPLDHRAHGVLLSDDDKSELVRLLKIHGSADWELLNETQVGSRVGRRDSGALGHIAVLKDENARLAIGAPGAAKARFVTQSGSAILESAGRAIRGARHLVILGYSLPGSDELVKKLLLGNLGQGDADNTVHVHVVLGPELESAPIRRFRALLASTGAASRRKVYVNGSPPAGSLTSSSYRSLCLWTHALGAEDFIARAEDHVAAKRDTRAGKEPAII